MRSLTALVLWLTLSRAPPPTVDLLVIDPDDSAPPKQLDIAIDQGRIAALGEGFGVTATETPATPTDQGGTPSTRSWPSTSAPVSVRARLWRPPPPKRPSWSVTRRCGDPFAKASQQTW
jgi:hypothetical protein